MLRSLALRALLMLAGLAATAPAAEATTAASAIEMVGTPAGFVELSRPREMLVDVYFGGRKIGETIVIGTPGTLQFKDPQKLVELVPELIPSNALVHELGAGLPTHADLVCEGASSDRCGTLSTDLVGIIFDESRFRVDLFFAPKLMRSAQDAQDPYLEPPTAPMSLTSSMGLAISGSSSSSTAYNVQNRTILALRDARIRADSSYASKLGLVVDDLVGEIDRRALRYSAGLFWAPGIDLTGRRRIVGLGMGTQFDTRADRESLQGTPLVLFLQQPARVEFLVDGRLAGSAAYAPGNNLLDTSMLPDGSYPNVLRIQEQGGRVREERRFFVKNAQIAPVGKPIFYAYAGMLANTRRSRPVSLSYTPYYQAGVARRLSGALALDLSALGTGNKNMAEAGAWLILPAARVRLAGLISTAGDKGALVQLASSGRGPLNFNFDLRRIWSKDGRPLLPLPAYVDNFGSTAPNGAQVGNGSYVQMSGSLGYSLGSAYLSVIGTLRHDKGLKRDYSVGPNFSWPVINRNGIQLVLNAEVQRTRTTTATFAGFRLLFTSRGVSMLATGGRASRKGLDGGGGSRTRAVGSVTGEFSRQLGDRTQYSIAGGFDRNLDSTNAHAQARLQSSLGSARADFLKRLDGRGGLQYGVTLQTGAAVSRHVAIIGGRDIEQSALVISLEGDSGNSSFEILVDDQPRGELSAGESLPLFLQPYHRYSVRLKPSGHSTVDYDSSFREVTLYPGNVEHLRWSVHSLFTVFGQAVRSDGSPVANALVQSTRGIGETDSNGYFQVDVAAGDLLEFKARSSGTCQVRIDPAKPHDKDYLSLDMVTCK
jgi:hypothetical protein